MELDQQEEMERAEKDQIWNAFMQFDVEQVGYMATSDLKNALEMLGEKVSDRLIFKMIAQADPENTGKLAYFQFKTIVTEKRENEQGSSDADLLDAFVAMGGQPDGDGSIDADKLIATIKEEFEMTIDIEGLIE